jgi:hypothetical protein
MPRIKKFRSHKENKDNQRAEIRKKCGEVAEENVDSPDNNLFACIFVSLYISCRTYWTSDLQPADAISKVS